MLKTEIEVEQDFYNALKNTQLAKEIKGTIYKKDLRPFNSKKEDLEIIVTSLNLNQLQEGIVTIIINLPLVGNNLNGEKYPNKKRIGEIEKLCLELPRELSKLMPTYNGLVMYSNLVSKIDRTEEFSYISAKIKFTYLTI